ncbi:MAG: DUF268 domain-containing protein [Desulfovibrionaceae bacterium]|nr:DUF268 domain-containing protein [Desulfovibrionaceae bacterium]
MFKVIHSLSDLPGTRVAVYGAGAYGASVRADLERERPDARIICFLDTFRPSGELDGLGLVNIEEANELLQSLDAVVIASANYRDIARRLEGRGPFEACILMRDLEDERVRRDKEVFEAVEALRGDRDFHRYFHDLYLWRYRALCREHFGAPCGLPPLAEDIPAGLVDAFTMNGDCEIVEHKIWDRRYPSNHPLIYTDQELDDCLRRIDLGECGIYGRLDDWLREALARHPIRGASVAVMGSISPWYEGFCICHGARPVTVDYNPIISRTLRIETITAREFTSGDRVFDHALSISSFEHDGLGAYGDPLDPDADLAAMRAMKARLRPGGLVFFNVPVAERDMIYFNEFRVYGRLRLPMILEGFEVLDSWGCDRNRMRQDPEKVFNPLFVLRNIP